MPPKSQPPLLQAHHIIDLYYWIHELTPTKETRTGRPTLLSDAEVLTLLIWNVLVLRQKTLKDLHRAALLYHHEDFHMPAYNTFVAHCHRSLPTMLALLEVLLEDQAPVRILDATMLPVSKLHRANAHKTAKNIAAFGKNWQGWHYGFKLHAGIDLSGRLTSMFFSGANMYDAQAMPKLLNEHCRIAVGDTLYGAKVMGKRVHKEYGTVIVAPPFPKQTRKIATPFQVYLLHQRSKIESVFDYLKEHLHLVSPFPRSINGYLLHYTRILLGYQCMALLSR